MYVHILVSVTLLCTTHHLTAYVKNPQQGYTEESSPDVTLALRGTLVKPPMHVCAHTVYSIPVTPLCHRGNTAGKEHNWCLEPSTTTRGWIILPDETSSNLGQVKLHQSREEGTRPTSIQQ